MMEGSMKRNMSMIVFVCFVFTLTLVSLAPKQLQANSFFWQGSDVSYSGPLGLLDYSKQKEVHDALLKALPVLLYPDGPLPSSYTPALDGLPNPNGSMLNGLVRMPTAVLQGPRGLRIPCEKGKCWEGYTLLNAFVGPGGFFSPPVVLIDMEGNIVHQWTGAGGGFGGAAKMLRGGYIVSGEGGFFGGSNLVQRDWCGNVIKVLQGLNNHHDHQREGSTDGYYYPGQAAFTDHGKSLSLGAINVGPSDFDRLSSLDIVDDATLEIVNVKRFDPGRPHRAIVDDVIREIPWDWDPNANGGLGNALFEWHARDYFIPSGGNLGFGLYEDEAAQYGLDLGLNSGGAGNRWDSRSMEDWSHGNSVAWLGNNIWYTKFKDERFHPDNIIADFRSLNVVVIIARHDHPNGAWQAGDIIWRLGPHYGTDGEDGKVGQIIGLHMAYMIPDTVPGGGNIMIFDNGGGAGYGALIEGLTDPDTGEKLGFWMNKYRGFSRVIEINPMTKQIVWQYVQAKPTIGDALGNNHLFYSSIMSGAQRFINGNTLITEADTGRVFEVNMEGDVVWEYAPDWIAGGGFFGSVYRAYRVPYSWVPNNALKDVDENGVYDMCE
jgi:hypothetical protein